MKLSLLLLILGLSFPCHAATLILGTTGNGNFEAGTAGKINFSTGSITNWVSWTEYDTASNDTGVEGGGDRRAFIQSGGAFRSTITETASAGFVYSYGFDLESGSGRGNATMVLLYQDLSNAFVEIPVTFLRSGSAAQGTTGTYTSNFIITAGSAWEDRPITVGFRLTITGDGGAIPIGAYPEIDNVTFSSVPEPSAVLLCCLGLLGLPRRRHA